MKRGLPPLELDENGQRRRGKHSRGGRFGPFAFKILCPETLVAKMMGNHGAVVHEIEHRTNTHLQLSNRHDYYPDTRLRILGVFSASAGCVFDAIAMLVDQVIVRAEEERSSMKGRSAGDFIDSNGKLIFRCALSKAAAGAVIGTKGERVRSLRESSGCMLDIAREVMDNHQLITIGGSRDQLLSVLDELNSTVQADAESPWFAEWAEQLQLATDGGGGGPAGPPRGRARSQPPGAGRSAAENTGCKLFVGRLSQVTDAGSLQAYFEEFGEVVDADVRLDPNTGRSKGFGFVTFAEEEMAEAVLAGDNAHEIDGRAVTVKPYGEEGDARPVDSRRHGDEGFGDRERERERDRERDLGPRGGGGGPPRQEPWIRNGDGPGPGGGRHGGFGGRHRDQAEESIHWFANIAESVPRDYADLDYCIACSLPSAKCGALIGRRGEHVADVQRITGASVSVSKKDPKESIDAHRTVTITGPLLSCYAAHLMLMRHYNDEEAQFRHVQDSRPEPPAEMEDLQRQLSQLSDELRRVKHVGGGSGGGGKGGRRPGPPGRPGPGW